MDGLLRFDLEPLGYYSSAFIDLLHGRGRSRDFYPRALFPFPDRAESPPTPAAGAHREFFDEMLLSSERAGASAEALAAGEALRDGRGFAVVTGQQPAILGGPLLTLYKIATAISLAREASKKLGAPVAAVYWNGADDVDRGEIASSLFADARGVLHRVTLPAAVPPPRTMVGEVPVAELSGAIEALLAAASGAPGEVEVRAAVARARERSKDLGQFASALLLALMPQAPLLVLDARSRTLRRAGAELFRLYVSRRAEVERAVNAQGEKMESLGLARALPPETTRVCLFATPGVERERLEGERAITRMEGLVRNEPESLSPNVVLRPILQESLFPNQALVAGPGEAAYLAQTMPAFALLGVRPPRVFPRLLATLLPEEARFLAKRTGMPLEAVLADPDASRRAAHPARATDDFEEAYSALKEEMGRGMDALDAAARRIDRSLPQLVESARRKLGAQIGRVHEGALSRIAAQAGSQRPGLKVLRDFLKPRGKPQEREFSLLQMPLILGAGWHEGLDEAAECHRRDLEAGRPGHYAFPAGPLARHKNPAGGSHDER